MNRSESLVRRWPARLVCVAVALTLSGCGEPVGNPCEITGDGFHAKDPCRHQCLSRWSLLCPDQQRITPNVCTGTFACSPGSCPEGQLCYHDDDPFDDRSFCVPDKVCGTLTAAAASAWERATLARQQDVIGQREEKQARRERAKLTQGAVTDAAQAPETPSDATPRRPMADDELHSDGAVRDAARERTAQTARAAPPDPSASATRPIDYDDADRELFGSCGLDLSAYKLSALVVPRTLSLDIDGDDALDLVAQVTRTRDGRRGLALCRAGTWLEWLGEGHPLAANEAVLSTLESLETWRVNPGDRGSFGFIDEPRWPETAGDVLVLERHEKSLVALYWRRGDVRAHVAFRLVEP